jgi:hypothetical protein
VGPHVGGPPRLQRPGAHVLKAPGERVQLVREQVPVGVQGDAGGRVAELLLHRLDAGTLADEQARGRVPQVVEPQCGRQAGGAGGGLEVAGDTIAAWIHWHQEPPPLVILDTLGKILPPTQLGEDRYQRDYRIGTALKRIVDGLPGMTLLVNHHDRQANADDFVDAVSGTHGLAGAADTIIVLARDRQEAAGLLKVTGRDVAEGEYAVTFKDGAVWELDGHDLEVAREKAQKVRATTRAVTAAGDRMLDVVLYAYEHPEGVRRGDVAKALKLEPSVAGVYLARAVDTGRLQRAERGLYTPVTSVTSLRSGPEDVTHNTRNTPRGRRRRWAAALPRRPGE